MIQGNLNNRKGISLSFNSYKMIKKYVGFNNPNNLETQAQRTLESEPFNDFNKYGAIFQSQCFDNIILQINRIKKALLNLIYLINQGTKFEDAEKEILFCKITKLFQHHDPTLKRLNYKVISLLITENLDCIIVQSLQNDLLSNNEFLRQIALSSIKCLRSLANQVQLVRFIQHVINDQNQNFLNKAIITGINLFANHRNTIKSWSTQLENLVFQNSPIANYHAFVLICEIKRSQKQRFNQFLLRLIKQPLKTLIKMQIIRFIQDVLQTSDVQDEKIYIDYLLLQIQDNDLLIVIEACKAISGLNQIDNNTIQPVVTKLFTYLESKFNLFQIFCSLKILTKIFTNPIRLALLTKKMIYTLENHVFQYRSQISSQALYLCTILQEHTQKISNIFHNIYNIVDSIRYKLNFFYCLHEFIIENPKYCEAALNFFDLILNKKSDIKLINESIKVIFQIFFDSIDLRLQALSSLIWLAKISDNTNKFKVVVFINQFLNNKFYDQIQTDQISLLFQDIQLQMQPYSNADYQDKQYQQINIFVELFLNNQCKMKYIEKMNQVSQQ
ncbi:hypothetical protein pb186bvf_000784 [Paramecium bursaria]